MNPVRRDALVVIGSMLAFVVFALFVLWALLTALEVPVRAALTVQA